MLRVGADRAGRPTIRVDRPAQICDPVEEPTTGAPGMPADIVTGEDADSVALYVAFRGWTARPRQPGSGDRGGGGGWGGGGEAPDGRRSSPRPAASRARHVLEAAGATRTVRPNLDDAKPSKELVIDRVTNGKGVMPAFKDSVLGGAGSQPSPTTSPRTQADERGVAQLPPLRHAAHLFLGEGLPRGHPRLGLLSRGSR